MGHSHDHGHSKIKGVTNCLPTNNKFYDCRSCWGFVTNSLALLSDAGHMLSDAVSLALSLLAFKLGEKQQQLRKHTGISESKC